MPAATRRLPEERADCTTWPLSVITLSTGARTLYGNRSRNEGPRLKKEETHERSVAKGERGAETNGEEMRRRGVGGEEKGKRKEEKKRDASSPFPDRMT